MKKILIISLITSVFSCANAECYIMGDSIAQGLAINRKDCSSETQVGLNTKKAVQYWLGKGPMVKDKVVISLGVNDGNINTVDNLKRIRDNLRANQVIWILPSKEDKSNEVKKVATSYGDYVLNINSQIGKDNIHPTGKGYVKIAEHIKNFQVQTMQVSMNDFETLNSKYRYTREFDGQ